MGTLCDIADHERMQDALRHYADRVRILQETSQAILAARSGHEVAETVLPRLRRLVPFVRASVALFGFDTREVSLLATLADGDSQYAEGWRGPLEWVWFAKDLHPGQIHLTDDLRGLGSPSPLIAGLLAEGVGACASVPLVAGGKTIGVLSLGMARPGLVSPEQEEILCEVADQLALGIVQARLHEQVRRHVDELERRVSQRTAALRASRAQLWAILESMPIGVGVLDTEGRLTQSNSALQEILGYSQAELHGAAPTAFMHPDDVTANVAGFRELQAGQRVHYEAESRFVRRDAQVIWGRLNLSVMRGGRNRDGFAVCVLRDITRQKEAQEALVQAEKLAVTGKLAASLAHEINNPLQAVIGCLGLAEIKLDRGEDIHRYLEVAQAELRRAARTVVQLRGLNRRSRPEERSITDLNALLERVLAVSDQQCQSHRVEVALQVDSELPPAMVVPDRIEQVFLNLVLNAVEAIPRGGRLEVNTSRTDRPSGIAIRFRDDGVGIPAEALPHLFEPFQTTRPEGLGLGLFVSANIVEEHGGRIEVESTVGEGTTFTVWLPV